MKRLAPLALMPMLVFATPSVAQTTPDMGRQQIRYGPDQPPAQAMPVPRPRGPAYGLSDTARPDPTADADHMIAAQALTSNTSLGVGRFEVTKPKRPFSGPGDESRRSGIAAVGLLVKF